MMAEQETLPLPDFDAAVMQYQDVIPSDYIWPEEHQPKPDAERELVLPFIDLGAFCEGSPGGDGELSASAVEALDLVREACEKHGFFQVINHGVDEKLLAAAGGGIMPFFELPFEEKQRARRIKGDLRGYANKVISRATSHHWKETLTVRYTPSSPSTDVLDYFLDKFGPDLRNAGEVYQEYCEAISMVALRNLELLAASLGLDKRTFLALHEDHDCLMRLNYYPRCQRPDLTLGAGPHFDPSSLAILQQDEVSGLQVFTDDCWWTVRPKPNALVVNVGDTFTALSNGKYKSCLHRVVVNSANPRTSIAVFISPSIDEPIRPPRELADDEHPRQYPDFTWAELVDFTQKHHPVDMNTLEIFKKWKLTHASV